MEVNATEAPSQQNLTQPVVSGEPMKTHENPMRNYTQQSLILKPGQGTNPQQSPNDPNRGHQG